ncbi:thermonuclease family protein [Salmonella enterica subsp. salamae serovar 42:b:e,n,x,z15]
MRRRKASPTDSVPVSFWPHGLQAGGEISGDSRDRYGRILGTLWADGRDINAELVCSGMAWAYRVRNEVQNPAREQKKGPWQESSPVPPWQWRKQRRPDV